MMIDNLHGALQKLHFHTSSVDWLNFKVSVTRKKTVVFFTINRLIFRQEIETLSAKNKTLMLAKPHES